MKTAAKILALIIGAFVMFAFGVAVGMTPTHATTQPAPVTIAQPAPAPAPAEPTGATHPLIAFSDGTYEVGTGDGQVLPGKYTVGQAAGPAGNYYAVRNAQGQILKNEYTNGPTFVTVAQGQVLSVSGGGMWRANSGW